MSKGSSDPLEGCFEDCAKNVEKDNKVIDCQEGCISEAETGGRARSTMGSSGKYMENKSCLERVSSLITGLLDSNSQEPRLCWYAVQIVLKKPKRSTRRLKRTA